MENDPYRAISIDSARINTSHVLMKECHIARRNNWHLTWACQKLETCSGELLLLLPRLATPLGLPWIPFISIELVCHWLQNLINLTTTTCQPRWISSILNPHRCHFIVKMHHAIHQRHLPSPFGQMLSLSSLILSKDYHHRRSTINHNNYLAWKTSTTSPSSISSCAGVM